MSTPTHHNRMALLDGLRGLAIFWIVCFHIMARRPDTYGTLLGGVISHGHYGVEIFLIISGFGTSVSIQKHLAGGTSALTFLKHRLLRIYVPYVFSLVFSVFIIPQAAFIATSLSTSPSGYRFPEYSIWEWVSLFTLTKIFTAQSWHLYTVYVPVNNPVWYLSIILQIYLVVAIALLFGKHYFKVVITLTVLSAGALYPPTLALIPHGLFLPYWPSFAVGILLFQLWKKHPEPPRASLRLTGLASLGILILIILGKIYPSLFFSNFIFSACCGLIIYILYPGSTHITKTPAFGFLAFLGSFSYSLYLLHDPLYRAIGNSFKMYYPLMSYPILYPITIVLVMILAYFWYLLFEKPFGMRSPRPNPHAGKGP